MSPEVRWSPHALRRLAERPIVTADLVEETVREPDQRYREGGVLGRWVAQKHLAGEAGRYLLRVFYEVEEGEQVVIVSFYVTSQVARYWRAGP
ncbi:MAG: DUF4258 domain-containing protein [Chloroflexi bacterium]|nr:DUF4258 domain-containing protein [Chloroflexota bacterium]